MARLNFTLSGFVLFGFLLWPQLLLGQTPEWIWHDNKGQAPDENEVRFFRKTFRINAPVRRAVLTTTGDDELVAFLNGKQVAQSKSWNKAVSVNVTDQIKPGENLLALRGRNSQGDAAVIARLEITLGDRQKQWIVTDTSWLSFAIEASGWQTPAYQPADWMKVVSRGKLGAQPWGDVMATPVATAAERIAVLPGFKVELLRSAEPGEGSWVAMTTDPKGRLIVSPQGSEPMLRVTIKDGKIAALEPLGTPVRGAMGMLYAYDSLYVNGRGPEGYHLYRLRDTNGDDQYDSVQVLRKWNSGRGGDGEHGAHGIVLGPDKKLYTVCGNFVDVPGDILPTSPHRNYADDMVLPRAEDGNGFGAGRKPPGGYVVRMDPDGQNAELFASGQRNTYDIGFSPEGELFGFDSDMEWDWGTPWYRPTRIFHVVSGGDYGFREGTAKWPVYYPDSLPPVVNIGIGSPTGVRFGTGAKFPAKYQQALYAMDWTYGRIVAVHLAPKGATYEGSFENFVAPKSLQESGAKATLNVTDLEIGPDGAMYFLTGGRGTQSGLYRVSFEGPEPRTREPGLAAADLKATAASRTLRHRLEAFHGKQDAKAVDFAWPQLNSGDRWIRYAARIAVESQPVQQWQERALEERQVNASLTALLALARCGSREIQDKLLESLDRLKPEEFSEAQSLEALRVLEVCFARLGRPSDDMVKEVIARLDPVYPARSASLNRELCQLLAYLEAPGVVKKTLGLLDQALTQEEKLVYVFHLRNLKGGWTMEDRNIYFSQFNRDRSLDRRVSDVSQWFADVGQNFRDGASFPKFMANIRKDAAARLTDDERVALAPILNGPPAASPLVARPRSFVKEWKMEDLLPALDQVSRGRNFEKGRQAFVDAQCVACHRLGNDGGAVGPDITAVTSRFTRRDILESILDPSKVVSEQYQNITVTLKNGDDVTGRLIEDNDQKLVLVTDPLKAERVEVRINDVQKRAPSKLSPMAEGLVNGLTKEEILDLLAYIESAGKTEHAAFRR